MQEYFKVNVAKYDPAQFFFVVRPASINNPKNHSVMFVNVKHIDLANRLLEVNHCLVFWPDIYEVPKDLLSRHVIVATKNPHNEFAKFFRDNNLTHLPLPESFDIVNGAYVSKKAKIGENVTLMPGAYIGGDCIIGDNCYIGCGVKIVGDVKIGKNVVIRENTVIGADGLTTDRDSEGNAMTIPQYGNVVIEDAVQIGASVVIARGAIDETRICSGSKIDSCVFISHNVLIKENSFIVGETILFGSASVGKNCLVSGNATLMNIVHIGDYAVVGAGAVVTKSVPDRSVVIGNPAKPREK